MNRKCSNTCDEQSTCSGREGSPKRLRAQVRGLFGRRCPSTPPATVPPSAWRYELLKEIGKGSKGTVYLARDRKLNRPVAVKMLEGCPDWESRQRFWREAECSLPLEHPNIVRVFSTGRWRGTDFIAMEYVPGKRLDQMIPVRGLPLRTCFAYVLQIAHALAAVHSAGMIHRDLKPANFIVSANETLI